YLLRGQAGAMSRTTGIHALLFSGLSRREGARGEVGVAPNLVVLAVALTALGLFAAIYHPVGTAMLLPLLASRTILPASSTMQMLSGCVTSSHAPVDRGPPASFALCRAHRCDLSC